MKASENTHRKNKSYRTFPFPVALKIYRSVHPYAHVREKKTYINYILVLKKKYKSRTLSTLQGQSLFRKSPIFFFTIYTSFLPANRQKATFSFTAINLCPVVYYPALSRRKLFRAASVYCRHFVHSHPKNNNERRKNNERNIINKYAFEFSLLSAFCFGGT